MASTETRRGRALLLGWAVSLFAVSAVADLRLLLVLGALTWLIFRRGSRRVWRKVLLSAVPLTAILASMSWGWLWLSDGRPPALSPFLALALRTCLIAFLTFSVLARVNLLRAIEPWPTATRLLVLTLAQIHALRLLVSESLQGLRSRLPRKPGMVDMVRSVGGLTGALFTLAIRNARDVSDAMRSRGF